MFVCLFVFIMVQVDITPEHSTLESSDIYSSVLKYSDQNYSMAIEQVSSVEFLRVEYLWYPLWIFLDI